MIVTALETKVSIYLLLLTGTELINLDEEKQQLPWILLEKKDKHTAKLVDFMF